MNFEEALYDIFYVEDSRLNYSDIYHALEKKVCAILKTEPEDAAVNQIMDEFEKVYALLESSQRGF